MSCLAVGVDALSEQGGHLRQGRRRGRPRFFVGVGVVVSGAGAVSVVGIADGVGEMVGFGGTRSVSLMLSFVTVVHSRYESLFLNEMSRVIGGRAGSLRGGAGRLSSCFWCSNFPMKIDARTRRILVR